MKRTKKLRLLKRNEKKQEQSPKKKAALGSASNAEIQKALKEAGLIASLLADKGPEKSEGNTPPASQHLRLVRDEEDETHGEREESLSEKTLSERWMEKQSSRRAAMRNSQKDLRFTLAMTFLLLVTFIATVVADFLIS